ncbi:hypothetical protein [Heyndrickxia acidicola]|uniref:Uncharacterized protein n=1 Tax=Heyndrickxia acidicola TaxID=209389 RepID=A0ABU6MMM0_9BACI|nr:hypothetical protein [Heyndrickxia acidicola]MED1205608.1 hypothetical protein [Heyndrickxia acidicola]
MKTCPYCGSGVSEKAGVAYCGFCSMKGFQPVEEGQRQSRYEKKKIIDHDDIKKSTPELMTYHTVDLLKLLKLLREERRAFFSQLSMIKKGASQLPEYKPLEVQTGNDYENLTRKTWIVENILNDRIGYIPNKITDQLLLTISNRMENDRNRKPMIIKKNQEIEKGISMER